MADGAGSNPHISRTGRRRIRKGLKTSRHFMDLPEACLWQILQALDAKELCAVRRTSSSLQHIGAAVTAIPDGGDQAGIRVPSSPFVKLSAGPPRSPSSVASTASALSPLDCSTSLRSAASTLHASSSSAAASPTASSSSSLSLSSPTSLSLSSSAAFSDTPINPLGPWVLRSRSSQPSSLAPLPSLACSPPSSPGRLVRSHPPPSPAADLISWCLARPRVVQLVYLLDGSGSVSEEDFSEMRRFVLESAPALCNLLGAAHTGKVGVDGSKALAARQVQRNAWTSLNQDLPCQHATVGVVQFSTEARTEVPLTPLGQGGAASLSSALEAMVRINGGTNISTALAAASALMKADDAAQAAAMATEQQDSPGPSPSLASSEDYAPGTWDEVEEEQGQPHHRAATRQPEAALLPGCSPGPGSPASTTSWGFNTSVQAARHSQACSSRQAAGGAAGHSHTGHRQGAHGRPVRLVLLLTDGRVDGYQAREARTNATKLCNELQGCVLAAFGVGRGVDRGELLHIITGTLPGPNSSQPAVLLGQKMLEASRGHMDRQGVARSASTMDKTAAFKDDLAFRFAPIINIFTKYVPNIFQSRVTPSAVEAAVRKSCAALQVPQLDLVQLHWWDYSVPGMTEVALALADCKAKGLIRHVGTTNMDCQALTQLLDAGVPVVANQYVAPPTTGIFGQRRYPSVDLSTSSLKMYWNVAKQFGGQDLWRELLVVLRSIADKHQVSVANVALRWVMQQGNGNTVHPIVGLRNTTHIQDNARTLSLMLDGDDMSAIADILARSAGPQGDIYSFERAG
ncbi:hypothetical protein QJQ45_003981 [Haematococcus lacustris]|nr:hypothetical protein QJQ45_003981 [Haematococcus lacustris]